MGKTLVYFAAVCAAPIFWMWMKIFVFHEVSFLLPLAAYAWILYLMAEQILSEKTTKMNKENQTRTFHRKHKSVQTEDPAIQAEEFPEMEPGISGVGMVEECEMETPTESKEIADTEESYTSDEEIIQDFDTQPTITKFVPFPYKEFLPGVKVTRKKLSFLVPTDPTLFDDDSEFTKNDAVAQWYLKYIKDQHAKKQRKKRRFSNLFKKKKNKTS